MQFPAFHAADGRRDISGGKAGSNAVGNSFDPQDYVGTWRDGYQRTYRDADAGGIARRSCQPPRRSADAEFLVGGNHLEVEPAHHVIGVGAHDDVHRVPSGSGGITEGGVRDGKYAGEKAVAGGGYISG